MDMCVEMLKGVINNFFTGLFIYKHIFCDVTNFLIKDSISLLFKFKFDEKNEQFVFTS